MPKYKKNVPTNTISRDMVSLSKDTENIYETVMIIAKRANQIAQETKQELEAKLQEFRSLHRRSAGDGRERRADRDLPSV